MLCSDISIEFHICIIYWHHFDIGIECHIQIKYWYHIDIMGISFFDIECHIYIKYWHHIDVLSISDLDIKIYQYNVCIWGIHDIQKMVLIWYQQDVNIWFMLVLKAIDKIYKTSYSHHIFISFNPILTFNTNLENWPKYDIKLI